MLPLKKEFGAIVSSIITLGPFHSAWRGPQRFVLTIDGEQVTDVEHHTDFNARGCAERIPRLHMSEALHLVARICGTCGVAHVLSFCLAIEQLCGLQPGERAQFIRSAAAELERAAMHLSAAGRVIDAVGMASAAHMLMSLCHQARLALQRLLGAMVAPDTIIPGGVGHALSAAEREELLVALTRLNRSLYRQIDLLIDDRALLARILDVGTLSRTAAEQLGVRGPIARASGIGRDTRIDQPYDAYAQVQMKPIVQEGGDVHARLVVLLVEALESVKLAEQFMRELPDGKWQGRIPTEFPKGRAYAVVEAARGPLRYLLESDGQRLSRVQIEPPRQLDRLLVRTLLANASVDNAVAIIASADHCTSCAEG